MANHFYLTCPSNSSMDLYPNNTLSNFKVKLNTTLELTGDYEVGLAEIQYPLPWHNIRRGQSMFTIRYRKEERIAGLIGKEVRITRRIPPGYYSNIAKLLETMNALLPKNTLKKLGIKISYNENTNHVTINTKQFREKTKNLGSVKLKHDVARVLGFDKETLIKSNTEQVGLYPSLSSGGLNHIYVYSDAVEEGFVGDVQAPLLRVLPIQNRLDVITVDKTFTNIYYMSVSKIE